MLVLTRREGQPVRIRIDGVDVWVMIGRAPNGNLQLLVEAPQEVEIMRDEALPFSERAIMHKNSYKWRHLLDNVVGTGGNTYRNEREKRNKDQK